MKSNKLNAQIYTEASEWLLEFRSGDIDAAGAKAFHEWLQISPEHMRAYLELAAIWNEGSALDLDRQFDDQRLQADVRADNNVVSLANQIPTSSVETIATPAHRPWSLRPWAIAASPLIAIPFAANWYLHVRNTYTTPIGEQRQVMLDDGSTVQLNADSRLRVLFSRGRRDVELRGQALFRVVHDSSRPFVVHAGSTDVRAVGTQFDVFEHSGSFTTVTVIEGRVAILYSAEKEPEPPKSAPDHVVSATSSARSSAVSPGGRMQDTTAQTERSGALFLAAGQQATITDTGASKSNTADVTAATAWTHHELIFKGTPLETVVQEFNRYNTRRLTITDPRLGTLRITGIFSSTDPSALIRFLEARPEIEVAQLDHEIRITRRP